MQAHEKGLKVWGLVDNFNENMNTKDSSFKNQFKAESGESADHLCTESTEWMESMLILSP